MPQPLEHPNPTSGEKLKQVRHSTDFATLTSCWGTSTQLKIPLTAPRHTSMTPMQSQLLGKHDTAGDSMIHGDTTIPTIKCSLITQTPITNQSNPTLTEYTPPTP